VLVVRPDGKRVGAGDGDLQAVSGGRLQELELRVVVRLAERRRVDDGRLRVVLVVEAADGAALLEAVGVRDRPGVHLAALLLAVVDDVDAGRLEQPKRVAARPACDLFGIALGLPQERHEPLMAVNADLLTPASSMVDVCFVERPACVRLHEPRWLR
jgi:hypothetical protein